jgi:TetR/AcrR family transcriptional repressor of mexJK operon
MERTTVRIGSPGKRAAIVRAALQVFLREGYARASVDAIAAEARVSKRTIYDYYGDKETLFLSALRETSADQAAAFDELLARTLGEVTDLEADLTAFGREFAAAIARSPERAAVMRLMIAEATHFPALVRDWGKVGSVQQALAARLAALADDGLLDVPDPLEAAQHFGMLVTGAVSARSLYGAVAVDDDEIDRLVTGGVRAFLRAYRHVENPPD